MIENECKTPYGCLFSCDEMLCWVFLILLELQRDENENFVPFNKELNARMSKISSKYTDKLSEEANNSLSFVMGVQENYRRNIEEDEEERDSFINAFLDQSATDGNKGKCSKFFKPFRTSFLLETKHWRRQFQSFCNLIIRNVSAALLSYGYIYVFQAL